MLCRQVACFCGTSIAAERLAAAQLPLGRSRAESELFLQQTAEAQEAALEVSGCLDIRPALEVAVGGMRLTGKQLEGVASTLEAAFALKARASVARPGANVGAASGAGGGGGPPLYPSLAALAAPIAEEERTLLRAIRGCIQFGSVLDAASESLAAVRAERADNKSRLRAEVEGWVRQLVAKGAAEPGAGVTLLRGRFCVGVRAGRQGELPKGSMRLGASSSGATLYVEPAPAVPLNNAEALLSEREAAEEAAVLGLLSGMLGSRAAQVAALVEAVVALDMVAARAKHGAWVGGVRPSFHEAIGPDVSPLHLPGAMHPVLMQRGLPPLPQPPSIDDNRFDRDFQAAPAWEPRRVLQVDGPTPEPGGAGGLPVPLDLRVPPGRAVVAITGPNTGGKTATLKAAGLLALMAQAGLFLPCAAPAVAQHGPPRLAWFRGILAAAGSGSLVLLDEVGSGTDPLEGAALARAVLDTLAEQALLTLATTHHAELRRAADEDGRYTNVSMAFDTASLRPTYRLAWGAAGASNALDIAQALGFDRAVVDEARRVAAALAASSAAAAEGRDSHLAGVASALVAQLEELRGELAGQRAAQEERQKQMAKLQQTLREARNWEEELRASPPAIVAERDALAAAVQAALDGFAAGTQQQADVEAALSHVEAEIPEEVARYRGREASNGAPGDDDASDPELLRPGDTVHVAEYGSMGDGTVVSTKGSMVSVRFDASQLFAAKRGSAKPVRVHRSKVRKVRAGQATGLALSGWRSEGFGELLGDIDRALADPRTRAKRGAAGAKKQSPVVLDGELQALVSELEADLDSDSGSPELNELMAAMASEPQEGRGQGAQTVGKNS
ncbi:hypothetical protein HYH03_008237 [Edaphochlamys debaryana]|uniref:DNA mismatch repair proteins mutS family domain-containing protein n=1 Tax=Edaphochlamys debaryana TaxID=47281 RepID=A0A835Y1V4_9CHLO|nr:hypothetical protein HYH03_008237 [Edaphochlamys debaryana]|eukprot:KAG2493724.1 hypothetical protein HYH03_008237 [Edaphochlamys debaryana]